MSSPSDYTYATHLDVKFPGLSLVDVPSLVRACTDGGTTKRSAR